jgi:hypothetical protein
LQWQKQRWVCAPTLAKEAFWCCSGKRTV